MPYNRRANNQTPRYASGDTDLPMARLVALVLLLVPITAGYIVIQAWREAPSSAVQELASFDPRSLVSDTSSDFLPTPVAALPAQVNSGPPAPAAAENNTDDNSSPVETVKVANTGGLGVVVRADPPAGRPVGTVRDGQTLTVLEHQNVNGDDWLRVQTPDGTEGWVYGRLVGPAN